MNRQQRRQKERGIKKKINFLEKLTPEQLKKVDELSKQVANVKIEEFGQLVDRNMSAVLIERDWALDEIERMQNRMSELLIEDTEKTQKLEKENLNFMKVEKEVREYIEGLLEKGISKKQAVDDLVFKFPKLSKSMLLNAYARVKQEKGYTENRVSREEVYKYFDKYSIQFNASEMIKSAMEQFGFTESTAQTYYYKWKKEYMSNKPVENVVEKEVKNQEAEKEKIVQAEKAIKKVEGEKVMESKLHVLEEVKIIKVKGENGEYEADSRKGVMLKNEGITMFFESTEQLDNFTKEFKEVFKMIK